MFIFSWWTCEQKSHRTSNMVWIYTTCVSEVRRLKFFQTKQKKIQTKIDRTIDVHTTRSWWICIRKTLSQYSYIRAAQHIPKVLGLKIETYSMFQTNTMSYISSTRSAFSNSPNKISWSAIVTTNTAGKQYEWVVRDKCL